MGSRYDERSAKRPRTENRVNDPNFKIRATLVRVQDQWLDKNEPEPLKIDRLADCLKPDIGQYSETILRTIIECAEELPIKTTVYGTLVGLLNAHDHNFVQSIVTEAVERLQTHVANNDTAHIKLMLRFFSELVNAQVVAPQDYLTLLGQVLDAVTAANLPTRHSDMFVYCLLAALPWAGREVHTKAPESLDAFVQRVTEHVDGRKDVETLIQPFADAHEPRDFVQTMLAAVAEVARDDWKVKCVPHLYRKFKERLKDTLPCAVPAFAVDAISADCVFVVPLDLQILDATRSVKLFERFVLRDIVVDSMLSFQSNRSDGTDQMLMLKGYIALFEPLLAETLISQLFTIPTSPMPSVAYCTYALEFLRYPPIREQLWPALNNIVDAIVERLDSLDIECVSRLADWFALILVNNYFKIHGAEKLGHSESYSWKWQRMIDTIGDIDMTRSSRKQQFISELLSRTLRLSFYDLVTSPQQEIFPAEFQPLMPARPVPSYRYADDGNEHAPLALAVRQRLEGKPDPQFEDWFKDKAAALRPSIQIDLLVQSLLMAGAESTIKTSRRINMYINAIKWVIQQQDLECKDANPPRPQTGGQQVLQSVADVYATHEQMVERVVEMLLNEKAISPQVIVQWVFSEQARELYQRSSIWSILHATIEKLCALAEIARADLAHTQQQIAAGTGNTAELEGLEGKIKKKLGKFEKQESDFFLSIINNFCDVLSQHLSHAATSGSDGHDDWYACAVGRFTFVCRKHASRIKPLIEPATKLLDAAQPPLHPEVMLLLPTL